jgi:hypothetical protein
MKERNTTATMSKRELPEMKNIKLEQATYAVELKKEI